MVTESSYVTTTQDVTTVYVNEDLYKEIIVADYFKKELIRKIPVLDEVLVEKNMKMNSDIVCTICVKMSIPTVLGLRPQNTVANVVSLVHMGQAIINIIKANGSIPVAINGIAKDCKPWFNTKDDDKKPA